MNCAGIRAKSSLVPFEHAFGVNPSVCSRLRSKECLRTLPPPETPFGAFRPSRQADSLPICAPERPYLARQSPFARLRPFSADTDISWSCRRDPTCTRLSNIPSFEKDRSRLHPPAGALYTWPVALPFWRSQRRRSPHTSRYICSDLRRWRLVHEQPSALRSRARVLRAKKSTVLACV
jgi:hypothetical protein